MIRIRATKAQLENVGTSDPQKIWNECSTLSRVKENRLFDENLAVITDQNNVVISVAGIIGLIKVPGTGRDAAKSRTIIGEVFPEHALMGTTITQASESNNPIAYVEDSARLDASSLHWNQYDSAIRAAG